MKLAALLLTIAIVSLAQVAPSTTLSGTVVDQSGASVPNAAADLTNTNTQSTRHAKTKLLNETHKFIGPSLDPKATPSQAGLSVAVRS